MRSLVILVVFSLLVGGCSGGDHKIRQVTAVDAARAALEAAEGGVSIRYNPAQCACAPFELSTAEGWIRVDFIEADDEERLDAFVARAESDVAKGILTEYRVSVSLANTDPAYCQNRVPYASLRLESD
jgi:hypothetical protein